MASGKKGGDRTASTGTRDTVPMDTPVVSPMPQNYDHSFMLQAIMQNQSTLGEVKEGISNIKVTLEAHGRKIERHGNILAIATGAGGVLLAIGGFVLDKMWDKISALVLHVGH